MFKKIKTTLACCSALMMLCAVPLNANAAEEVKINDAASVAVGDSRQTAGCLAIVRLRKRKVFVGFAHTHDL